MTPARTLPRHVGIIMDGNGRWAQLRDQPRIDGHRVGAESVRDITRAARRPSLQASAIEPAPRNQAMVSRGLVARVASVFPAAEPPLRSPPVSL